jgi:hypothetical protein
MYPKLDYPEKQVVIEVKPEVEVALIEVAGKWAIELQKSNSNLTPDDLVQSFRDVYSSLILMFLMPEK